MNTNKKYFSYYYGKVDLDAMMSGEHLPVYIHGVDEEVWGKLGLHPNYLKSDDHIYFWTLDYCRKEQNKNDITKEYLVGDAMSSLDDIDALSKVSDSYYFIRDFFAVWGNSYLGEKELYLAQAMYLHGIYGEGKSLVFSDKQLLTEKVKNSNKLASFLETIIEQNKDKETIEGADTIEFEEGKDNDLFYSIQHCNIAYMAEKNKGAWNFKIIASDTYDFTKLRIADGIRSLMETENMHIKDFLKGFGDIFSRANMANDLGTVMQVTDMMKPYFWFVEIEIIKE